MPSVRPGAHPPCNATHHVRPPARPTILKRRLLRGPPAIRGPPAKFCRPTPPYVWPPCRVKPPPMRSHPVRPPPPHGAPPARTCRQPLGPPPSHVKRTRLGITSPLVLPPTMCCPSRCHTDRSRAQGSHINLSLTHTHMRAHEYTQCAAPVRGTEAGATRRGSAIALAARHELYS